MNGPTLYSELIEIYRENNLHNDRSSDKLLQMINNKGAVLTVKELIRNNDSGFGIEEIVLKNEYSDIFNEEDREICKEKLRVKTEGGIEGIY